MKNFNYIHNEDEAAEIIKKAFGNNARILIYNIRNDESFELNGLRFKYYGKSIYNQDFTLVNDFEIINAECGHINTYFTNLFRTTMALVKDEENYLADLEKFLNNKVCSQIESVKKLIKKRKEEEAE